MFRIQYLIAITVLAATAGLNSVAAQEASTEWRWPSGRARVSDALRERLLHQHYTAQERRNIQSALDRQDRIDRDKPELWRSKDYKPAPRPGFYVLHEAFGWPKRMGYSIPSIANRIQTIENLVAKGDWVILQFRIVGNINGPMFGFEATQQAINMAEESVSRFDRDGMQVESAPWSAQDLNFYQQLGGKVELPKTAQR